jgi:predicted PurR-regulated permease PerM
MLGLIPPLVLAIAGGTAKVLWVVALYVLLHIFEGYVLVPFLMHRKEHLPAPLVVISILVCSKLFGTLGVILAVPLATAGYVLLNETVYAPRAGGKGNLTVSA